MQDITALYIRLSLEDIDISDLKKESTSVQNQRLHLWNFLTKNPDINQREVREFIDDGYSGTNFQRPAFSEMMELICQGRVKCIIVKDFSRLGRNYLEVGNYLEQVFPKLNTRFISVDDHYDSSENKGDVSGIDVVFKNIIHDHYSKELSSKVVQSRRNLAKKGLFQGGIPPYGYIRNPNNKYQLLIDSGSAKTVRRIFAMTLAGKGRSEIARIFNAEEIESPAQRLWRLGIRTGGKDKEEIKTLIWRPDAIRKILINEAVIGNTVNHKVERKQMGKANLTTVQSADHIIVENTHEPIIDRATFARVQKLVMVRSKNHVMKKEKMQMHALSGTVKCGYCARSMALEGKSKKTYICSHSRVTEESEHKKIKIKEEELLNATANILYFMIQLLIDKPPVAEDASIKKEANNAARQDSSEPRRRKLLEVYEQYVAGEITKELFLEKKQVIQSQRSLPDTRGAGQCNDMNNRLKGDWIEKIRLDDSSWLTKDLVKEMIKEIKVFPEGNVKIIWKCDGWLKDF